MRRQFGITGKAVGTMSFIVLSIMLLIATFTYKQSENLMRHQIERELSVEIENVSNEVASFFEQKGEIVRQLSITPVMKKLITANETQDSVRSNEDYPLLQQLLNETKENNDHINLFWLADLNNNYYIANDDQVSNSDFTIENRPWYLNAQKQQAGISYSSPYTDIATQQDIVSITHPVLSENELFGYIGVDVQLNDLPIILQRFEKNGHHVILTSNDGQILYDKQNMWSTLKQENLIEEKILRIGSSKDIYYTDIRQVGDLGWKIAIYVPEDVFLEPLAKYQSSLIAFWVIALVILLTALSLVLRYLLRDIPLITKQLEKIEQGDFNARIGITRNDEVGTIAYAVDKMAQKIQGQVKEMNYQAHFDSLTKLPNRLSIESTLEKWLLSVNVYNQIMAVVFLDLDHFKSVNDSKGHAYGDELLIQVGQRIQKTLPSESFFGRFGGDEFILLLFAENNDVAKIQDTIKIVHESFDKNFKVFEHTLHVTTSMGVAFYPEDAQTIEELFVNADTALYEAKEAGRNLVYFFNPEMKETFEKSFMLQRGLRTALDHNEFSLHYQPQFDIKLGKITSVEALLRWEHPQLGMISPADFIPLAEKSGQIIPIGDWVIDTSLQAIKRIQKDTPEIQRIAINVSAIQLREPDFVSKIKEALDKHDASTNLLEFEITESVIIIDEEDSFQKIEELKALGIQIAMDDFGTGYSSLNYLHMMDIDRVKVDRSFIKQLEDNPDVISILKTIIKLGHSLGFEIVAEGVENEAQLQLMHEMKVDSIQGFYFSRPLDEAALTHFLKKPQH